MPERILRCTFHIAVVLLMAGCSTTKNISVSRYVQDKDRVDQEIQGTVGNWQNAPMAERTQEKDTRKIYIVEFSKNQKQYVSDDLNTVDNTESMPASQAPDSSSAVYQEEAVQAPREIKETTPKINLPSFDEEQDWDMDEQPVSVQTESGSYIEYTVEKSDTLQKISKKFYDSYSKWPQIYEANKTKIKDPNKITPGITIRIPE